MKHDPIARTMNTCAHFSGISNETCRAGVRYDSVKRVATETTPFRLACFKNEAGGLTCDKAEWPTREDAERKQQERIAAIERVTTARRAIVELTHGKRGVSGRMECPVCHTGELGYSVAGVNGHIWGHCTTRGCVSWME